MFFCSVSSAEVDGRPKMGAIFSFPFSPLSPFPLASRTTWSHCNSRMAPERLNIIMMNINSIHTKTNLNLCSQAPRLCQQSIQFQLSAPVHLVTVLQSNLHHFSAYQLSILKRLFDCMLMRCPVEGLVVLASLAPYFWVNQNCHADLANQPNPAPVDEWNAADDDVDGL